MLSHSVLSDSLQPIDCSLPGSPVHGILQARILEWVAIPFFPTQDLPNPGTEPGSPTLQAGSLPSELHGKPTLYTRTQLRVSEQSQSIARFPHDGEDIPKSGQVQDLSFCSWNSLESKVQWGGP